MDINVKNEIEGLLMVIYGTGLQGHSLGSTFEAFTEQILSIIRAKICQMDNPFTNMSTGPVSSDAFNECRKSILEILNP